MQLIDVGYNDRVNNNELVSTENDTGYRLYVFHTPATLNINGKSFMVNENNAILINCAETHRIHFWSDIGECFLDWIGFDMDINDLDTIKLLEIPFNKPIKLTSGLPISNLIMNLAYLEDSCQSYNKFTHYYILTSIIFNISAIMIHTEHNDTLKNKYPEIVHLKHMIMEQPQLDWTMDKMSELTHFSVSRVHRLYQQIYSVSCKEEVILCRLKKAERLLTSTTLSVSNISEQCGFNSYEHFTRTFKKRLGRTPTEYRNLNI